MSVFFLTYDIKIIFVSFVNSFIFEKLRRIMSFSERHSVLFVEMYVTSLLTSFPA